jgi:hypothetical protein
MILPAVMMVTVDYKKFSIIHHLFKTIRTMNKLKPILFSTEMVQAIQEGRKTQTRRVIKPQLIRAVETAPFCHQMVPVKIGRMGITEDNKPIYQPGDILYVRETFRAIQQDNGPDRYEYKATEKINVHDKWQPSIFMPFAAARIFLKVTEVKAERLHSISWKDAKAEGIKYVIDKITGYCGYNYMSGGYNLMTTPLHGFLSLWESINGRESRDSNPWVWAYTFKPITYPFPKFMGINEAKEYIKTHHAD